jgi:hypothetical protein
MDCLHGSLFVFPIRQRLLPIVTTKLDTIVQVDADYYNASDPLDPVPVTIQSEKKKTK